MKFDKNAIRDERGQIFPIRRVEDCFAYLERLFDRPEEPEGGMRKYLTKNGPSSGHYMTESITNTGLMKTLVACLCILADRGVTDPKAEELYQMVKEFMPRQWERSKKKQLAQLRSQMREIREKELVTG